MSVKRLTVEPHVAAFESGAKPHVFDLDQLFADRIACTAKRRQDHCTRGMTIRLACLVQHNIKRTQINGSAGLRPVDF